MNNLARLTVLLSLFSLFGCASERTHYYALRATQAPPLVPADASYRLSIGVGPVFLPETMNQPGVVSYTPGQEVNIATYHVWAGYLNQGVTRVLADNLSILLGADTVWPFPWDNRNRPVRQVRVVIEEMAGERGKEVTLQAKWTLVADNGETVLASQRSRLSAICPDNSYESYIKTINQLLNLLSVEMAKTLLAKQ